MDGESVTLEEGIQIIDKNYVDNVIDYLETGVLKKSNHEYIKCYT
jgi:hypothetical protein